jgi:LysR family transcriptional regulator, regulator for metE and metH
VSRISAAKPLSPRVRPRLELRDLELVLALAAARSTAAAATSLHLTQSAVSRALGQAESRLGVELFTRSARGLAATPAGQALIDGAPAVLQQLYELEQLAAAPLAEAVHVRLVCECYTAYRWLPSAMSELKQRMPDLNVEVATAHTRDPVAALLQSKIDVALLTTAEVPKAKGLLEQPLFSDEVVFVLSARHPLAKVRHLTREALCDEPLITGNTPPAEARWFATKVFGRRVPKLHFVHFPLTEAIIDATRAGMGIAVLSEWMASGYLSVGDLVVKRLTKGPLRRPWRIAYRREAKATAERLRDALQSSVPRLRAEP